jgi:predicted NUDIX family phosphoesterase
MTEGEKVLGFPAKCMHNSEFTGFTRDVNLVHQYKEIIRWNPMYHDRKSAETNPFFKQIIPYCLITYRNTIYVYQRTKKGGESRLHDLYSLGVGGHINPIDESDNTYETAMKRELLEEVGDIGEYLNTILGLLYDPSNEVGQVHFGVVHEIYCKNKPDIKSDDPSLSNGAFRDKKWILENQDKFENWSKLVIGGLWNEPS